MYVNLYLDFVVKMAHNFSNSSSLLFGDHGLHSILSWLLLSRLKLFLLSLFFFLSSSVDLSNIGSIDLFLFVLHNIYLLVNRLFFVSSSVSSFSFVIFSLYLSRNEVLIPWISITLVGSCRFYLFGLRRWELSDMENLRLMLGVFGL